MKSERTTVRKKSKIIMRALHEIMKTIQLLTKTPMVIVFLKAETPTRVPVLWTKLQRRQVLLQRLVLRVLLHKGPLGPRVKEVRSAVTTTLSAVSVELK